MLDVLAISGAIGRARGSARVGEIEINGHTYELRRDSKKHARILANLYCDPKCYGRGRVPWHELRGMHIHGEEWLDEEGDGGELAWLAPAGLEFIEPGPDLINAAARAFFRAPWRVRRGRHPSAMGVRSGDVCEDCGDAITAAEQSHHIVPRAAGGEDAAENEAKLCLRCHERRTAAGGPILVPTGYYLVEPLQVPDIFEDATNDVRVRIAAGTHSGRRYWVRWGEELPAVGALYRILMAREDGEYVAKYVEEIEAVPAAPVVAPIMRRGA